MLITVFPVPFSPEISVQVPRGSPPSMSSSKPIIPVVARSIAASLMIPFFDRVKTHTAEVVECILVEDHLVTVVSSQLEVLGEEDRLFRADIFKKVTVDTTQ